MYRYGDEWTYNMNIKDSSSMVLQILEKDTRCREEYQYENCQAVSITYSSQPPKSPLQGYSYSRLPYPSMAPLTIWTLCL